MSFLTAAVTVLPRGRRSKKTEKRKTKLESEKKVARGKRF